MLRFMQYANNRDMLLNEWHVAKVLQLKDGNQLRKLQANNSQPLSLGRLPWAQQTCLSSAKGTCSMLE